MVGVHAEKNTSHLGRVDTLRYGQFATTHPLCYGCQYTAITRQKRTPPVVRNGNRSYSNVDIHSWVKGKGSLLVRKGKTHPAQH